MFRVLWSGVSVMIQWLFILDGRTRGSVFRKRFADQRRILDGWPLNSRFMPHARAVHEIARASLVVDACTASMCLFSIAMTRQCCRAELMSVVVCWTFHILDDRDGPRSSRSRFVWKILAVPLESCSGMFALSLRVSWYRSS